MNYHLSDKKQAELKMQEYQLSLIAENWQKKYNELELKAFSDCFPSEENKTLSQLFKTTFKIGEQDIKYSVPTKYLLFNAVKDFASYFNLTNNFKDEQIQDFVNDIFEFYSHLTVRDIKFFLRQVKMGNFGQIYNRLDGPLLFGYLKVYNDLRIGEAERHESNLTKAKDIEQYDERIMLKRLAPLFQKKPEPIEQNKKVIEPDETYLKIHKDFCSLHAKQGSESGAMFVKYNGKMMNFEEYYNTIFNETFEK
jgi:hypothetical protein